MQVETQYRENAFLYPLHNVTLTEVIELLSVVTLYDKGGRKPHWQLLHHLCIQSSPVFHVWQ